jgi:quercetin dioxygenase-like cupin family protein
MKIKVAEEVPAEVIHAPGAVGATIRWLIRETDGAPNFCMRQLTVAPGGSTPRHTHAWEHEAYVLAGSGVAYTPDGDVPISAGMFIFVAPNEDHQFRNTGTEEMKFLCMIPKT